MSGDRQEMGVPGQLTNKHYILFEHILAGEPVEKAAVAASISYSTARRWLKESLVKTELERLRSQVASQAVSDVRGLITREFEGMTPTAIQAIKQSLDCELPAIRLKAAQMVLERVIEISEAEKTIEADQTLLSYLTEQELATFDALLEVAQQRKAETEEKITPMRARA